MWRLTLNLCNEVVRELDFRAQCAFARDSGYDGLEIAPFTLADDPTRLTAAQIAAIKDTALSEGTRISGLHWLLAAPTGLSITSDDDAMFEAACAAGLRLIDLCAGLGGSYLVHGSPRQRELRPGEEASGRRRALAYFARMAQAASDRGVSYILEPLARGDTKLAASVDEAVEIVGRIGSPALRTMVDCYAVAANGDDVAATLDRWLACDRVAHVHLNDDNKGAPGQGGIDFASVIGVLRNHNFAGEAAIEPFVYNPDGPACAGAACAYVRALERGEFNDPARPPRASGRSAD